ncbi:MAG: hypothetical protein CSB21_03525 [Deltaproteobacteria bacterium]|nr:MAG: hypothetical protein CSB21_03525 [Deltaproteobacteria bacterium]
MITVCAGVAFNNGNILIAKRKKSPFKNFWEFPGGKIEKNESPELCLKREIKEELSVDIEIISFLHQKIHNYEENTIKLLFYNIRLLSYEIKLIDHIEFRWEKISNLHKYKFPEADFELISKLERDFKI